VAAVQLLNPFLCQVLNFLTPYQTIIHENRPATEGYLPVELFVPGGIPDLLPRSFYGICLYRRNRPALELQAGEQLSYVWYSGKMDH
jgi:hypothetical protein